MGNWFKKLDNPNNHKACLWSFHPTAFGAIHKQVFKLLGSFRNETMATMAFPQMLNCILEGVVKPAMVTSLFNFQEALKAYWEKSGRTPQLHWWHENAPWLPNGKDRQQKLSTNKAKTGAGKSSFEVPVHSMTNNNHPVNNNNFSMTSHNPISMPITRPTAPFHKLKHDEPFAEQSSIEQFEGSHNVDH